MPVRPVAVPMSSVTTSVVALLTVGSPPIGAAMGDLDTPTNAAISDDQGVGNIVTYD